MDFKHLKTYQLFEQEISDLEKKLVELEKTVVTEENSDDFKKSMRDITKELVNANLNPTEADVYADRIYSLNNKIPANKKYAELVGDRNKVHFEGRFVYTGKQKSSGEISEEDFKNYCNCLIKLIDTNYDKLAAGKKDFEFSDGVLDIVADINGFFLKKYWMFKYKEDWANKIKFQIDLKSFKPEFKDDILKELEEIKNDANVAEIEKELEKRTTPLDEQPLGTTDLPPQLSDAGKQIEEAERKAEPALTVKDDAFVKDTIKIMVEEKLTSGMHDTDENRIFKWFCGSFENKLKTANKANVDAILIGYRNEIARTSVVKDSLSHKRSTNTRVFEETGGFMDTLSNIGKQVVDATKSVVSSDSDGLVKDLINAFNSDVDTVNSDIDKYLRVFTESCQRQVRDFAMKKESFDISDAITVASVVYGGIKARGFLKGVPKEATTSVSGGLGRKIAAGALKIATKHWITLLVVTAAYTGYKIFTSIAEQQSQLANIFVLMYASESPVFLQECAKAGVKFPNYSVDVSILKEFINPPVTESKDDISSSISKLFSFFKKRKVDNKIAVSMISEVLGINKILFVVDKPFSESYLDLSDFYLCYDNKYYSIDGGLSKDEVMKKESLSKNTFNDKTFYGNSFKTKKMLKDLDLKVAGYIRKEFDSIVKEIV